MSDVEKYSAKDITLSKVLLYNYKLESIDLKEYITSFQIYEDLFSNTMRADFMIGDAVALVERFPIIGEELIEIEFKTPTFEEEVFLIFRVFSLSSRGKINDRLDGYQLSCVSREYIPELNVPVDKAYTGFYIGDVVNAVYTNYMRSPVLPKSLYIEPTIGKHSFIAPQTGPLDFINMLASEARSEMHPNESNYLFYEDHDQFNFRTVTGLLSQTAKEDFYYNPQNLTKQAQQSVGEVLDYQKIESIQYTNQFDVIKQHKSGFYDNNSLVVDTLLKKHEIFVYKYEDQFDKLTHLGGNKVTSELNPFVNNTGDSHSRLFVGNLSNGNYYQTSYLDRRCTPIEPLAFYPSQRYRFVNNKIGISAAVNQNGMNITIPGYSDLKPGDIVNLFIPESSSEVDYERLFNRNFGNLYNDARFLVVRVMHDYNTETGEYITVFKAIKDSFAEKIETELDRLGGRT